MSELQRLARTVTGDPPAALARLLVLVCEQLAMDVAAVSSVAPDGTRTVRVAVDADGSRLEDTEGRTDALVDSWCGGVVEHGVLLVGDAADPDAAWVLPGSPMASCAGVALRDERGTVVGTLCALGHRPHATLNPRDAAVLQELGEVVTPLLQALDRPVLPRPRAALDLAGVADAVGQARDVEALSRPLLEALHELTGLASAYLTVIHEDEDTQSIRYAVNTRPGFAIPEGLSVPWGDTLCKRALDEGRPCTTDVPAVWGDSEAAAGLGIQVYASVPVQLSDGRVWGTLCAADATRRDDADAHLSTMRLFARLIAGEVEREVAVRTERERAEQARQEADTDALTGCASRRVVEPHLEQALSRLRDDEVLALVYVDVDAFKPLNDVHGHAAGDRALVQVGSRLRAAARPGDLVARLGGDEFLVAATVRRGTASALQARLREAGTFDLELPDARVPVQLSVGLAVSDGSDVAALLAEADRAMYADKQRRRDAVRAGR